MAEEAFPREQSGLVVVPQERILLPQVEATEVDWPVHAVRFNRGPCTLIVDVDEIGLVDRLIEGPALSELIQHGFQPKQGLHMTVINLQNGGRILGALRSLPADQQEEILQTVEDMAESMDWSWQPTRELRPFRGRKKEPWKIITRVECPAFDAFYKDLYQLMPTVEFNLYPPHITVLKQPGEVNGQVPSNIGGLVLNRLIPSFSYPTIE